MTRSLYLCGPPPPPPPRGPRRLSLQLFLEPSNFFQLKKEVDSIFETLGLLCLPNTKDQVQCAIRMSHFVQVEIPFESNERFLVHVILFLNISQYSEYLALGTRSAYPFSKVENGYRQYHVKGCIYNIILGMNLTSNRVNPIYHIVQLKLKAILSIVSKYVSKNYARIFNASKSKFSSKSTLKG
jgi:hypothetical protein